MFHVHALLAAYGPGPSDKLPLTPVSKAVPEHAAPNMGSIVGSNGWSNAGTSVDGGEKADAAVYVASKPALFTDVSDVKTTYSWPLDDGLTVTPVCVPVRVSSSGADDVTPS